MSSSHPKRRQDHLSDCHTTPINRQLKFGEGSDVQHQSAPQERSAKRLKATSQEAPKRTVYVGSTAAPNNGQGTKTGHVHVGAIGKVTRNLSAAANLKDPSIPRKGTHASRAVSPTVQMIPATPCKGDEKELTVTGRMEQKITTPTLPKTFPRDEMEVESIVPVMRKQRSTGPSHKSMSRMSGGKSEQQHNAETQYANLQKAGSSNIDADPFKTPPAARSFPQSRAGSSERVAASTAYPKRKTNTRIRSRTKPQVAATAATSSKKARTGGHSRKSVQTGADSSKLVVAQGRTSKRSATRSRKSRGNASIKKDSGAKVSSAPSNSTAVPVVPEVIEISDSTTSTIQQVDHAIGSPRNAVATSSIANHGNVENRTLAKTADVIVIDSDEESPGPDLSSAPIHADHGSEALQALQGEHAISQETWQKQMDDDATLEHEHYEVLGDMAPSRALDDDMLCEELRHDPLELGSAPAIREGLACADTMWTDPPHLEGRVDLQPTSPQWDGNKFLADVALSSRPSNNIQEQIEEAQPILSLESTPFAVRLSTVSQEMEVEQRHGPSGAEEPVEVPEITPVLAPGLGSEARLTTPPGAPASPDSTPVGRGAEIQGQTVPHSTVGDSDHRSEPLVKDKMNAPGVVGASASGSVNTHGVSGASPNESLNTPGAATLNNPAVGTTLVRRSLTAPLVGGTPVNGSVNPGVDGASVRNNANAHVVGTMMYGSESGPVLRGTLVNDSMNTRGIGVATVHNGMYTPGFDASVVQGTVSARGVGGAVLHGSVNTHDDDGAVMRGSANVSAFSGAVLHNSVNNPGVGGIIDHGGINTSAFGGALMHGGMNSPVTAGTMMHGGMNPPVIGGTMMHGGMNAPVLGRAMARGNVNAPGVGGAVVRGNENAPVVGGGVMHGSVNSPGVGGAGVINNHHILIGQHAANPNAMHQASRATFSQRNQTQTPNGNNLRNNDSSS